jgi:nucleotide-binding universal stress UspA family protein
MRIVCSIDASEAARSAARVAGRLAERMRAELVLVNAQTGESSARAGALSDRPCGLLVVGFEAPGRMSSLLLGDPYRRLARDAGCPVMVVPAGAQLRAGANVVLGYDLPTVSSVEAAVAGRLADALDSSLVVTHVDARLRPAGPKLRDAARRVGHEAALAAGKRLEVRHVERRGRPSEHLDAVAADEDGGVIVVGTRRPGWRGALHRSAARRLQRLERHPVVVVPRRASLVAD